MPGNCTCLLHNRGQASSPLQFPHSQCTQTPASGKKPGGDGGVVSAAGFHTDRKNKTSRKANLKGEVLDVNNPTGGLEHLDAEHGSKNITAGPEKSFVGCDFLFV